MALSKKKLKTQQRIAEQIALTIPVENRWRIADNPSYFSLDQVFEMTTALVAKAKDSGLEYNISVGTDSQIIKRGYRFVTVLCVYMVGKGGMYYYLTDHKIGNHYNQSNKKMRMFDEVSISIEVANALFETTGLLGDIHIDASPEEKKEFTSSIVEQLQGYAVSCGFGTKIKPESYCANFLADKHSKSRPSRNRRIS